MSRKILVIAEDSAALCCQQALCTGGYDVHRYEKAAGIHAAITGSFDAILLCPSGPAFDLLAILREVKAAGLHAPVLVLSRNPSVEEAVATIKEGATDYFRQPESAAELRSVFDRIEGLAKQFGDGVRGTRAGERRDSRGCSDGVRRCERFLP